MTTLATAPAVAPDPPPGLRYHSNLRYTDRATKAAYIADKYRAILSGSVLDVGCDTAPLRGLVGHPNLYVGVDVRPDADTVVNLDKGRIPFANASFDTVVCTDVLEHLERCHAVFDELCRVARAHVIVSLPNPLRNVLDWIAQGMRGPLKHYGLPTERPSDRHRWFFGHDEATLFIRDRAARAGFSVAQMDAEDPGAGVPPWIGRGGRDLLDHPSVRAGTLWCVLER